MIQKILIGIGTYKRNELLANALKHIAMLEVPEGCELLVAISDNNLNREAFSVFEQVKDSFPFGLYYEHEPSKSIAAVRNAVLKKALDIKADYIAFIDDDEYPKSSWIKTLYETMHKYNADGATSEPVLLINGQECKWPYKIRRRKNGQVRKFCITNSVIFKSEIIQDSDMRFDTAYGLMTGEDIDFFTRASNKGFKFVWCDKALLYDICPEERLSVEWLMDRTINNAYLKIFNAKKYGENIKLKYLKLLLDLFVFSFIALFCFVLQIKYHSKCNFKLLACFGKLKAIMSDKAYSHYRKDF